MRFFEAWRQALWSARSADTRDNRLAFQAGARHALNQLIKHLDGWDEETKEAALRLNDEIHSFATVALLDQ